MKDIRPGTLKQLIFIGMLFGKAHITFDGFLQCSGGEELLVELLAKAQRESDLQRLLVAETFVDRGCGGSRGTSESAEGEAARPANLPKTLCGLQSYRTGSPSENWPRGAFKMRSPVSHTICTINENDFFTRAPL
jgi:hypothetical protein